MVYPRKFTVTLPKLRCLEGQSEMFEDEKAPKANGNGSHNGHLPMQQFHFIYDPPPDADAPDPLLVALGPFDMHGVPLVPPHIVPAGYNYDFAFARGRMIVVTAANHVLLRFIRANRWFRPARYFEINPE